MLAVEAVVLTIKVQTKPLVALVVVVMVAQTTEPQLLELRTLVAVAEVAVGLVMAVLVVVRAL
jgi:hypothetical protein